MKDELQVGPWRIRPLLHELTSPDGESVRVEPKSMAVLLALAEEPGEVRTRDELLDAVWADTFVTEEVLSHAVWDLRRALGDDARKPTFIQTIPRTGYRLLAPVTRPEPETEPETDPEAESSPSPPTGVTAETPRPKTLWAGLAAVLALLVGAGAIYLVTTAHARPVLRVVVPEIQVADDSLRSAASGVEVAALATLASLDRVAALDPDQIGDAGPRPVDIARATAADEVLVLILGPAATEGSLATLSVRRTLGADGRVLWTDRFEIPTHLDGARLLADTVRARLLGGYPERRPEDGSTSFGASDGDYRSFLEIRGRLEFGDGPTVEDLDQAEEILESSPTFLEGYLIAVRLAVGLYRDRREPAYFERGLALQERAEALSPEDSRPLLVRLELEVADERYAAAAETLDRLEERVPGDPRILPARAKLEEQRGELTAALPLRQRAVAAHPSWVNLYLLAHLEQRLGEIDAARESLAALLDRSPENRLGLSKLAEIELSHGDLVRAEQLYRHLLERRRQRNYLTNLGIVQFLRGNHAGAVDSYTQALGMAPGHPVVLSNLAEAEMALGRRDAGRRHYEEVAHSFQAANDEEDPDDDASTPRPMDAMMHAVALARLDQPRRAVAITQATAQRHPEHSEVAYQAAMVYALVGDRQSALVNVEKALELGLRPRWFRVPGFDGLAGDLEFEKLLAAERQYSMG